jgi:hypothetical protein
MESDLGPDRDARLAAVARRIQLLIVATASRRTTGVAGLAAPLVARTRAIRANRVRESSRSSLGRVVACCRRDQGAARKSCPIPRSAPRGAGLVKALPQSASSSLLLVEKFCLNCR